MVEVLVLGRSQRVKDWGFEVIEIPDLLDESEVHYWVLNLFANNDIDKLVIEMDEKPELALQIGFHIRLTIEELGNYALIPLLYVSHFSLEWLFEPLKPPLFAHLLSTKGVYFSFFKNIQFLEDEIRNMRPLLPSEYKSDFFDIIHPQIFDGITYLPKKQSLADAWSVYRLDKSANTNVLLNNPLFEKNYTKLYFKYAKIKNFGIGLLVSSLKKVGQIALGKSNTIEAYKKRILFVDDEADKGWEMVFRAIFTTAKAADFVVIKESIKKYEDLSQESKDIIEKQDFDLYLIDFKLSENNAIDDIRTFSGVQIMNKIKAINLGNQVIMLISMDKIGYLKTLLSSGIDGYYLKEMPEYGFSSVHSNQNYHVFKMDAARCLTKGYLKFIFNGITRVKTKLRTLNDAIFLRELRNQINLFWDMLQKSHTQEEFAYSYITLYLVIEMVNNYFVRQTKEEKWYIKDSGLLLEWTNTPPPAVNYVKGKEVVGEASEWQKITGLYLQKWKPDNHVVADFTFLSELYFLIRKRNAFVHKDIKILEQKKNGLYLNRDVYSHEGIVRLFKAIEKIIDFL
ncbi:MAG: hypothetical protein LBR36_06405 [Bacteroidales bacterium]|jgi:hypothetical protein|nr:hypothetical protein [Bacteroidales bacterium]